MDKPSVTEVDTDMRVGTPRGIEEHQITRRKFVACHGDADRGLFLGCSWETKAKSLLHDMRDQS